MFYFVIPLVGRTLEVRWDVVCELLAGTLRSTLNQTSSNLRVLVTGQDRPDVDELNDPRVSFLPISLPYPDSDIKAERADQWKKVCFLFQTAIAEGATMISRIDADDRVSNRLVEYSQTNPDPTGHLISNGYVWDYQQGYIAPSYPVLKAPFHMRCGSCVVFDLRDLKRQEIDNSKILKHIEFFGTHTHYQKNSAKIKRKFSLIDFPAAVYTLNHGAGLAYRRGWNTNAKLST